ncbi:hypothetical protein AXX17_AT2G44760 [Arabidopsis thaliana]|uniref:Transmembrane protein n=1 Tax=Arabidopsis thaliana TaxID=3702 RepID=A0A178VPP8_ARATH|nr:hypothetical protein AXX17_AT2G44760 [Arabidopsis thaliana]
MKEEDKAVMRERQGTSRAWIEFTKTLNDSVLSLPMHCLFPGSLFFSLYFSLSFHFTAFNGILLLLLTFVTADDKLKGFWVWSTSLSFMKWS